LRVSAFLAVKRVLLSLELASFSRLPSAYKMKSACTKDDLI
jgi:hypothetical protein